jgi:hypothetical protein
VLDILDAADLIAGVVKDGRKAWDQDRLRQLAVEATARDHRGISKHPER